VGQVHSLGAAVEGAAASAVPSAAPAAQPVEQPHGDSPVVRAAPLATVVIIGTLGKPTVLRAGSFPEWQDEHEHRPLDAGQDYCIEEHS